MLLFILAILFISALGFLAQTSGLCLVRGVNEAKQGQPMFLLAILCSGSFSWLAIGVAESINLPHPLVSSDISIYPAVGGFIFGLGAVFNHGCGVSTISKLARGQVAMLATITGWLISWICFTALMPELPSRVNHLPSKIHVACLMLLSLGVLIVMLRLPKPGQILWASILLIGFMASIIFLYEPRWTPSGLLRDISLSLYQQDAKLWPKPQRFALMLALIMGMVIAALKTHSFQFSPVSVKVLGKHLLSGLLMGLGAVIAGGGNDSQLLLALPALSPAGFIAVLGMLIGIYIGGSKLKVNKS